MLSPLLQQETFLFDVLMSDPKALATLSEELFSCVSTSPITTSPALSTSMCCTQPEYVSSFEERLYAANEAPASTDGDLSAILPIQPERPASSSSGKDIESAGSETSATTPTLSEGFWDHELLHPRVLGREESALFRRQRAARREQRRLAQQREAFEKLQDALPGNTSRMSRLDLLRLAISHIQDLHKALEEGDERDVRKSRSS